MRYLFLILIFCCQSVYGQDVNRFSVDVYGHKINAARLPGEYSNTVRLGDMEVGEHVRVYANAMLVDDSGGCWLDPDFVAFPLKSKGELEIINNKLGYIVRVNYSYVQNRGYFIPKWPSWNRGKVPAGYIPVKAVVINKPIYGKSASQELALKMKKRVEIAKPPVNPYSWEE